MNNPASIFDRVDFGDSSNEGFTSDVESFKNRRVLTPVAILEQLFYCSLGDVC